MKAWRFLTILIPQLLILPASAIIGGEVASDATYGAIGTLVSAEDGTVHCTATLVSPEWILTAEHCREGGTAEEPRTFEPEELQFVLGARSSLPLMEGIPLKRWRNIRRVTLVRDGDRGLYEPDIAFAQLSRPVERDDIKPIGIDARTLALKANAQKKPFEMVGFGTADYAGSEETIGTRKVARVSVTSMTGNAFLTIFGSQARFTKYLRTAFPDEVELVEDFISQADLAPGYTVHVWDPSLRGNQRISSERVQLSESCYGDSGGPLLSRSNGRLRVVGVISSGFRGKGFACLPLGSQISVFGPAIQHLMKSENIPFSL